MATRPVATAVLLALAACLTGCGAKPPAAPGVSAFTGSWVGRVSDALDGDGTARLVLAGQDGGITGDYSADFAGDVAVEGAVSGSVFGTRATAAITPAAALDCGSGLTLTGTLSATLVVSSAGLSGQYTGFTCGGVRTGRLDLVRE